MFHPLRSRRVPLNFIFCWAREQRAQVQMRARLFSMPLNQPSNHVSNHLFLARLFHQTIPSMVDSGTWPSDLWIHCIVPRPLGYSGSPFFTICLFYFFRESTVSRQRWTLRFSGLVNQASQLSREMVASLRQLTLTLTVSGLSSIQKNGNFCANHYDSLLWL